MKTAKCRTVASLTTWVSMRNVSINNPIPRHRCDCKIWQAPPARSSTSSSITTECNCSYLHHGCAISRRHLWRRQCKATTAGALSTADNRINARLTIYCASPKGVIYTGRRRTVRRHRRPRASRCRLPSMTHISTITTTCRSSSVAI